MIGDAELFLNITMMVEWVVGIAAPVSAFG